MVSQVNRDRVQLLVDALESDEFAQGKGALRLRDNGKAFYCCLGVATEVAVRNGLSIETAEGGTVWAHEAGEVLCDEVRDWYGFESRSPMLTGRTSQFEGTWQAKRAAHQWNDSYNATFKDIAVMFRREYLGPETAATD